MDTIEQNDETVQQSNAATTPDNPEPLPSKNKKKLALLLPLLVFVALLLVGSAAAYMLLVQKSPEEKFASALENTGEAIETIVLTERTSNGVSVEGRFDVTSPIVADGSLSGTWQDSTGSLQGQLNALGAQVDAEVRAIVPDGALAPDVYINLNGLNSVAGLLGIVGADEAEGIAALLSTLEGKWYVINHTLLESPISAEDTSQIELTEEEIDEITRQALVPIKERLLSSNPETAVFKINEIYGEEQYQGDDTIKMNIGINRDNFVAFIQSYKTVVENTKLKELLLTASPGSSIDEILPFDDFEKTLDAEDFDNGSADVWVESNGRFIRNIRLYPTEDRETNYLDFSLPYQGGDVYPLEMTIRMDEEESVGNLVFKLNYNQTNADSELLFDVNLESEGGLVSASGNLAITGSDEPVEVSAPESATNILEVLGEVLNPFQSQLESQLPEGFDGSNFESLDDIEIQLDTLNL